MKSARRFQNTWLKLGATLSCMLSCCGLGRAQSIKVTHETVGGTSVAWLEMSSSEEYSAADGRSRRPILAVRCQQRGKYRSQDLYFFPGSPLAGNPQVMNNGTELVALFDIGFDLQQLTMTSWAGDGKSYRYSDPSGKLPDPLNFVQSLFGHNVFYVHFLPIMANPSTADFDLAGLPVAFDQQSECTSTTTPAQLSSPQKVAGLTKAPSPISIDSQAVGGDAPAQFLLGLRYAQGQGLTQDYVQAADWYRKAAVQGFPMAQLMLGYAYENGQGVQQDFTTAAEWYRKAADLGSPQAEYSLGRLYFKGLGVAVDYAQAAALYRKAAEQGDVDAEARLGDMYSAGQGEPQSNTQAAIWWRKAAEQGDADSQFALAGLYQNGLGVPQDYAEAYFWFDVVSSGDSSTARAGAKARDDAATHLIPAVLLETQERARKWDEDHSSSPQ